MKQATYALVVAGFISLGCGADETDGGPFQPATLSLTAHVPAGGEVFQCRYFVMPDGPRDAIRFEHDYTAGSHHILLYPTTLSAEDIAGDNEAFDCNSRGDLAQRGVAYGADEQPVGELTYPEGVGMHFEPGEVVLLEAHYLNVSEQDLHASVSVTMHFADEPVPTRAGTLFYYNWAILVPPSPGEATAAMSCVVPDDIQMLYATSHMHRRGVQFRSHLSGGALTEPMKLHETNDWEAPPADTFWPALPITAGQRINFECDFRNDMPHVVTEGESADTNEMCMFIASYWPQMDADAEFCLVDGSGPVLSGDRTCSQTISCLEQSTDDVSAQQCLAQTCSASSSALSSFVICMDENNCWTSGDSCVENNCLDQYYACAAATCDEPSMAR